MPLQSTPSEPAKLRGVDAHVVATIDDVHLLAGIVVFDRLRHGLREFAAADHRTYEIVAAVAAVARRARHDRVLQLDQHLASLYTNGKAFEADAPGVHASSIGSTELPRMVPAGNEPTRELS